MTTLTLEEKQTLYRDGYVVVRNAVSSDLVDAALDALRNPHVADTRARRRSWGARRRRSL